MMDNDIQIKLKDRKFSYFTQQMATKSNRQRVNPQTNQNIVKVDQNLTNNSEANFAMGMGPKLRFQENPMRFSQLG